MIVDEIRKQKAASDKHYRVAWKQIAMLSQIMSTLELEEGLWNKILTNFHATTESKTLGLHTA